jgi:hypothetical protein
LVNRPAAWFTIVRDVSCSELIGRRLFAVLIRFFAWSVRMRCNGAVARALDVWCERAVGRRMRGIEM